MKSQPKTFLSNKNFLYPRFPYGFIISVDKALIECEITLNGSFIMHQTHAEEMESFKVT